MSVEQREPAVTLKQQALRLELKTWERTFAEANGGRKANKEDIKNNRDIAAKYKEYNKLRAYTDAESTYTTPRKSRKRKTDAHNEPEFAKALHPSVVDPYDAPQSATTTPRIVRTAVGPTPQKNGQILGLFDMLSPYSTRIATPSKKPTNTAVGLNVLQTPSRNRSTAQTSSSVPGSATPGSSVKRRRLGSSQTPSSLRHKSLTDITPSANRLNRTIQPDPDETPAFLKRFTEPSSFAGDALGTNITYTPPRIRLPRKPVGRTLSQLVQSLREQEDDRLDEELALMREIETGEPAQPPKLLVQDSQIGDLPLGPDGEHDLSAEEDENAASAPRRLWKKKGQKRTTRRANIGVSRAKWKPETEWKAGDKEHENEETITETQDQDRLDDKNGASDAEYDGKELPKSKAVKKSKPGKDDDKAQKKTRKINPNATSHANFRSLKIRNKNSKGRKGGRFGHR